MIKTPASSREDTTLEDEDFFEQVTSLEASLEHEASTSLKQDDSEFLLQPPSKSSPNRPPSIPSQRVFPQSKVNNDFEEHSRSSKQLLPIVAMSFSLLTVISLIIGVVVMSNRAADKLSAKPTITDEKDPNPNSETASKEGSDTTPPSTISLPSSSSDQTRETPTNLIPDIIVRMPKEDKPTEVISIDKVTISPKVIAEVELKFIGTQGTGEWKPILDSDFYEIVPTQNGRPYFFELRLKSNIAVAMPNSSDVSERSLSISFKSDVGVTETKQLDSKIACFQSSELSVGIEVEKPNALNGLDGDYLFEGQIIKPVLLAKGSIPIVLENPEWILEIRELGNKEWNEGIKTKKLVCNAMEHYGREFQWSIQLRERVTSSLKHFFPVAKVVLSRESLVVQSLEKNGTEIRLDSSFLPQDESLSFTIPAIGTLTRNQQSDRLVLPLKSIPELKGLKDIKLSMSKWKETLETKKTDLTTQVAFLSKRLEHIGLSRETWLGSSLYVRQDAIKDMEQIILYAKEFAVTQTLLADAKEFSRLRNMNRQPEEEKAFRVLWKSLIESKAIYPSYSTGLPVTENEIELLISNYEKQVFKGKPSIREVVNEINDRSKAILTFIGSDIFSPRKTVLLGELQVKKSGKSIGVSIPLYANVEVTDFDSLLNGQKSSSERNLPASPPNQ